MTRYTDEFLAAVRHRYEDTDQPLRLIVAEFEIGMTTLQTLVQKNGWAKRSQRARNLRPASRLIDNVIALADLPAPQGAAAATQTSASRTTNERDDGARACSADVELERTANSAFSPSPLWGGSAREACRGGGASFGATTPTPGPSPQGGGEHSEFAARPTLDAGLARVEAFLLGRVAAEQAAHARRGGAPQESADRERSARTISILLRALHSLRELRSDVSTFEPSDNHDDDMPADIDEFRNELARRIDAFVASRTGAGDDQRASEPADVAKA